MPRGKKNSNPEDVTLNVPENANQLSGTENGAMRVYASKPKKAPEKKQKSNSAEKTLVAYPLGDTNHPIEDVSTFVHIIIYWIPNSKKFMIENPSRMNGKLLISAPTEYVTSEDLDIEAINAIFGMHFTKESSSLLESLRDWTTSDTEHVRVLHICELGLVRDNDTFQYTYVTY